MLAAGPSSATPLGAVEKATRVPTGASRVARPPGVAPRNFRRRPSGPTMTPPAKGLTRQASSTTMLMPVRMALSRSTNSPTSALCRGISSSLRVGVDRHQVVAALHLDTVAGIEQHAHRRLRGPHRELAQRLDQFRAAACSGAGSRIAESAQRRRDGDGVAGRVLQGGSATRRCRSPGRCGIRCRRRWQGTAHGTAEAALQRPGAAQQHTAGQQRGHGGYSRAARRVPARRPERSGSLHAGERRRFAAGRHAQVIVAELAGAAGQLALNLDHQQADVGFPGVGAKLIFSIGPSSTRTACSAGFLRRPRGLADQVQDHATLRGHDRERGHPIARAHAEVAEEGADALGEGQRSPGIRRMAAPGRSLRARPGRFPARAARSELCNPAAGGLGKLLR